MAQLLGEPSRAGASAARRSQPPNASVRGIMHSHSESEYEMPEVDRSLPAWAFSLLVHASAMVFVMTAIQLWPETGGNGGDGSIEVVMLGDSDHGPLRDGDEG